MADFRRDQRVVTPASGDPLWLVSHFFPKWLHTVTIIISGLIGLAIVFWLKVDKRTALLIVSAAVFTAFVVISTLDNKLLQWDTHRNASFVELNANPTSTIPEDLPVPFGYKTAWIAVSSQDGLAVAQSLGLNQIEACSWAAGIQKAYDLRGVFITPPILGWTIAVGAVPDIEGELLLKNLESTSKDFHKAFYFGTHRVVEYQAWAIAEEGKLLRVFAWLGDRGEFPYDLGERTTEEIEMETGVKDFGCAPDEETVLELAARWVLDPRELEELHRDACGPGLFGTIEK